VGSTDFEVCRAYADVFSDGHRQPWSRVADL
jgi:hypothetical protein